MTTGVWIVEDGQLVEYKRAGQCNQCGECCCAHTISYRMSTRVASASSAGGNDEVEDWSDSEGWSALYAQGIWWWFWVENIEDKPDPCPAFDMVTKQCARWQDMEDFRPICRYWPVNPKDIAKFPQCGFSFERIVEGSG